MTTNTLADQINLAALRQQAERLGIPDWSKMRKTQLLKAISQHQSRS